MIPNTKVLQFVQQESLPTPYLLTDLEEIVASYQDICKALPFATCYYAIKANPTLEILRTLVAKGSCFETASIHEVELCLEAGSDPQHILFGNTVKKISDIQKAYAYGIRTFVIDDLSEIKKLAEYAPGTNVLCRVIDQGKGAIWPLSRKFGCHPPKAIELLKAAHAVGLNPVGVSFHVGSEQRRLEAWAESLTDVACIFEEMARIGVVMNILDIGGGFPTCYDDIDSPDITHIGQVIESSLKKYFPVLPTIIIEPGRFIVANSGTLVSEVILVSENRGDGKRWVYLDIGTYNGLSEAAQVTYPLFTFREGEKLPVILAGPTADSGDVVETDYQLPTTLQIQDKVLFMHAGAYSFSLSCAIFNGFPPLYQHCIA